MGKHGPGFFGRAREKGSRQDRSGIDGAQVHTSLEPGTKIRYASATRLWIGYVPCPCDPLGSLSSLSSCTIPFLISSSLTHNPFDSYCAEYDKDPVNGAYDLETLKDFMHEVGHGMDGIKGKGDLPSLKSVLQAWTDFTAEFRRNNNPIPPNTTLSVTNVRISVHRLSSYSPYTPERC